MMKLFIVLLCSLASDVDSDPPNIEIGIPPDRRVDTNKPQRCDYNYAFVVDESGGISRDVWYARIDFIISLIENNIEESAQLMALTFSSTPDWIYRFIETQNPRDGIINALTTEKNDYDNGPAHTKRAIQAAIQEFVTNGFTDDNILILVTDNQQPFSGQSPCEQSILDDLNNNNIRVIIIGESVTFNPAGVACLVGANINDIITIDDLFNLAPVIAQLVDLQAVCTCNPCTAENIAQHGLYYPSCTSCCRYIQCDQNGGVFDMPCAGGTYWDPAAQTCNHNLGHCTDAGCTLSPAAPVAAQAIANHNPLIQHIGEQNTNVEYKSNYYGYIMVIGVISFILINNVFIGCWCLDKGRNKAHAKFNMLGVNDEI